MNQEYLIPKIVQIEPIFGCNAHCIMCAIDVPTERKKGAMKSTLFSKIVQDLVPHRATIEQIDLFGLGEPLLDPVIFAKISALKKHGLKGVGISTNSDLMDEKMQKSLLDSGVDTVIFSIDGTQKEIHEKIRVNTVFERVVGNTKGLIKKRNDGNYQTKFLIRFIRQDMNRHDWKNFQTYWSPRIKRDQGDRISVYDAHNWVGEVPFLGATERIQDVDDTPCYQVFQRMFILQDGTMSMCSCDLHHPYMPIGNVGEENCLDIYNNDKMKQIRELHNNGRKTSIDICLKCNMLYSRQTRAVA